MDIEIQYSKTVWVAWTNSDLTEGRGVEYPLAVCDSEATARRKGKKGYVMGCECPITKEIAVKVKGRWLAPTKIYPETKEDKDTQRLIDKKKQAFKKAKEAGLTDDEIKLLR